MFDLLPGSQRSVRSPLLGLVAALVSHAAIVAIVLSSRTARGAEPRRVMVVDPGVLSLRRSSATPHAPGVPVVPGVPPDLPVIDASRLPPLDLGDHFQTPVGASPVAPSPGGLPGGGGVWDPGVVDERPEVLSGPPLVYPEGMRQAGMEGRVVVEVVIDTLGRAEPGSSRTVESSQRAFDAAALTYVRRALFRPARVMGRPVRVLIRLPIEFRIAR